jgi:hypothetical protein
MISKRDKTKKKTEGESRWRIEREYQVQFFRFEDEILENLNQDNLKTMQLVISI